jgi:dynein heavy chain
MTDAQVADEKFLVLINDMLASGEINGLFTDDETAEILTSVKNEVRAQGIEDTKENCWKFFIDKVRRNLKVRFFYLFKRILMENKFFDL